MINNTGSQFNGEGCKSLWLSTCLIDESKPLDLEVAKADAVVIGAGLAGILTAFMLQEKGINTIVLEASRIGHGTTGNTTGKVTLQHDLIYDRLITSNGEEKARQYAVANRNAISMFRQIINENSIDCDFEDKPSYLYTTDNNRVEDLKKEAEAATKLGMSNTLLLKDDINGESGWGIPVIPEAALKYFSQAQFHPLKFIKSLSKNLKIYENTRVIDVQEGGGGASSQDMRESIITTEYGKVTAKYVIFTCHFPFPILPGYYFARMYQDRTYALALTGCSPINGIYLGIDQPSWSFRNYNDMLILVGAAHRTGENEKGGNYQSLLTEAKRLYPNSLEKYCWSTQDCMPLDGIPYMGEYASGFPNWYVATGFQKWGMTSSMVAADIISSKIAQKQFMVATEGADVFTPLRFTLPVSAKEFWGDMKTIGSGLLREIFSAPEKEAADILPGHGGVVELAENKSGVFKDTDGDLHAVPTRCTHMGCQVAWNPEEQSWDCPCHGSRFDIEGKVISGPAVKSLYE